MLEGSYDLKEKIINRYAEIQKSKIEMLRKKKEAQKMHYTTWSDFVVYYILIIIVADEPQQATHREYFFIVLGSVARDFANLERYQNRQPAIYNAYFGINLISAV